jgi:hypothetical protein
MGQLHVRAHERRLSWSAEATAQILQPLVVVGNQLLDRGTQSKLIERRPSNIERVRSVDDGSSLSFFSSSQRFSVYEVGVLVVSCNRLPRCFSASRHTLQLFAC